MIFLTSDTLVYQSVTSSVVVMCQGINVLYNFFRKRQEEYKDKSYEQWLAEKETTKRQPRPPPGAAKPPPGDPSSTVTTGVTGPTAAAEASTAVKSKRTKQPQTANDIIKSIIKRKEEEGEPMGDSAIDLWYAERDNDLMEQIRLGKTPLQRRLQQRVIWGGGYQWVNADEMYLNY